MRACYEPVHPDIGLPDAPMYLEQVRKSALVPRQDSLEICREVAHQTGDLTPQDVLIDGQRLPVLDHRPSVNDHGLHATSGFCIHELSRGAVVGKIGHVFEVDQDQVCLVAGPDRAEAAVQTSRARIAKRGVAENLVCEHGAWLWLADRRQEAE